ncbi:hypothetical protein HHA01_13760 [Halomonas halmophila]|uniref:Uncharacterized protein n=1 Tax=Halomonas halmophila TaxID=252 RepID=A0A4Y4EX30_9GAMM|nr:hypothetical protein HHA01_13760 [Halomonas halmophila]
MYGEELRNQSTKGKRVSKAALRQQVKESTCLNYTRRTKTAALSRDTSREPRAASREPRAASREPRAASRERDGATAL